jgi:2-(1,2-epoxy-1,2-dihydrophenyl)acetyl-CoA isomerase
VADVAVAAADGVATITLNRPAQLNALTVEMVAELRAALETLAADRSVGCIVLTGAGRAFCAGADIGVLRDIGERRDEQLGRALVDGCRAVYQVMRAAPQPVLCSLNGAAAGGGANLALACDLRIAADSAKLGQVFVRLGLHPDWGGTWFLPRLVGPSRALELFLGGEMIDAGRLAELGIVNRVVPADGLTTATAAWAAAIAGAPREAVRLTKWNTWASGGTSLDAMLDRELEAQLACFNTPDFSEGLSAFLEKRTPNFTGR